MSAPLSETLIRLVVIAAWAAVMAYMATGAWAAATGRGVRRADPTRLAWFLTGALFIGYNLRTIFWPGSEVARSALHWACVVVALQVVRLGWAYGRGDRL